MKIKHKKGALDMSFAWIFALIAGAFIIALAIFAVTKFIGIESTTKDVETSKGIGVLLNPLETSFETGKTTSFTLPVESRIYASCSNGGKFGNERIKVNQKVYGKWSETDTNVTFINKYIFAKTPVEGKSFYVFSKPFNMPFKVADLIYVTSTKDNYCFVDSPSNIKNEISLLNPSIKNLYYQNCPEKSINVCFGRSGSCEIKIDYNLQTITKNGETVYFSDDSLMYAGIFSDFNTYECQVKRLMKRTESLSFLYADKETFLSQQVGCNPNLKLNLLQLGNLAGNFGDVSELNVLDNLAGTLDDKNFGDCKLW